MDATDLSKSICCHLPADHGRADAAIETADELKKLSTLSQLKRIGRNRGKCSKKWEKGIK